MPTYKPRPAAMVRGEPYGNDHAGGLIDSPDTSSAVARQLICEQCGESLRQRKLGRPKRFCSTRCRKAAHRESSYSAGISSLAWVVPDPGRNGIKKLNKSGVYGTQKRGVSPQFIAPKDILGRGYRWPQTPRLDRKTWVKIVRAEIGD